MPRPTVEHTRGCGSSIFLYSTQDFKDPTIDLWNLGGAGRFVSQLASRPVCRMFIPLFGRINLEAPRRKAFPHHPAFEEVLNWGFGQGRNIKARFVSTNQRSLGKLQKVPTTVTLMNFGLPISPASPPYNYVQASNSTAARPVNHTMRDNFDCTSHVEYA